MDVINCFIFCYAVEYHAVLGLLACHVLHPYVMYVRDMSTFGSLLGLVVDVYPQYGFLTLTYCDVTHEDILCLTATAGVCLYTQHAVEVWRVHFTVLGKDILYAGRNLRAYHYATVAVSHFTVTYDDIA